MYHLRPHEDSNFPRKEVNRRQVERVGMLRLILKMMESLNSVSGLLYLMTVRRGEMFQAGNICVSRPLDLTRSPRALEPRSKASLNIFTASNFAVSSPRMFDFP